MEKELILAENLKCLLTSTYMSIEMFKSIDLTHINTFLPKTKDTPLFSLCENPKITTEIIQHAILSGANFDEEISITVNEKQIQFTPLTILFRNPSINLQIIKLLTGFKLCCSPYEKHKKYSAIYALCQNENITKEILEFLFDFGYDLFQYSIVHQKTSFDELFESPNINLQIVMFLFSKYELKLLFSPNTTRKLFTNPNISYEIIMFINEKYPDLLKKHLDVLTNLVKN